MNTNQQPAPQLSPALAQLIKKAQAHPELNFMPLLSLTVQRGAAEWEDFFGHLMGLIGEQAAHYKDPGSIDAGQLGHVIWVLNYLREAFRDVSGRTDWDGHAGRWE